MCLHDQCDTTWDCICQGGSPMEQRIAGADATVGRCRNCNPRGGTGNAFLLSEISVCEIEDVWDWRMNASSGWLRSLPQNPFEKVNKLSFAFQ